MAGQSVTILISRPPDEVFAFMDDVGREHEWQPNLRSATKEPPGPTAIGTLKRYTSDFMGRSVDNCYEVTELEPGRRVVYRTTKDSSLNAVNETTCEPAEGGTRITMRIEARPKGILRLIPRAVLEETARMEVHAALERLKGILES